MDHLHIPESCKPQAWEIPYFGVAPKYDGLGFDGFLERVGKNPFILLAERSLLPWQEEWINSFFQEWFWFGLMDEFAKAFNISINFEDFIKDSPSGSGKLITTELLYDVYARRLAIRTLDAHALLLGFGRGDLVRLPVKALHEETKHQTIDFLRQKTKQDLLLADILQAQATEKLSKPYGEETPCQDENGMTIPIDTLVSRIIACHNPMVSIHKDDLPETILYGKTENLTKNIKRAQSVLRILMEEQNPHVRIDISVSIDILCHTLSKIISVITGEYIMLQSPDYADRFLEIMRARNWCPSRISGSLETPSETPLGYVASLLPSYETDSHAGCRGIKCLKRPSVVEAMTGLHREECDKKCPYTKIPEAELIHIWKAGGIPGVRLAKDMQPWCVDIVDCTGEPFIAISHVWSHGLGNANVNELPSCQIQFLFQLLKQLHGEVIILWIDTLSVPIEPESKRIAISMLRRVFTEASKVLVIDKHLMQVGTDRTEQIMQLLSSEWQRRLWTLQEGRMARELFIQFKESAVSVSGLLPKEIDSSFSVSNADLFDFYGKLKRDMKVHFSRNEDINKQFRALVQNLGPRSVSIKSDEPICLATLLGMSLEDYHPYPTMADIYRSLVNIPQGLMFEPQPRLQEPGLTWAPSTFLETGYTFLGEGLPPARLSKEGLHVTNDCLLLDKHLDFRGYQDAPWNIYVITTPQGQNFAVRAYIMASPEGQLLHVERSRVIKRPAVIWEDHFGTFAVHGSVRWRSRAVLVSRLRDRKGVTYCRFEMNLSGWHIRDEYREGHEREVRLNGERYGPVSAKLVNRKSFCVG